MYKLDSSGREHDVKQASLCTRLIAVVGRMT